MAQARPCFIQQSGSFHNLQTIHMSCKACSQHAFIFPACKCNLVGYSFLQFQTPYMSIHICDCIEWMQTSSI